MLPDKVREVVEFCARWQMSVRRTGAAAGPWTLLIVEGDALAVHGFAEVTGMYRRA